MSSLIHAFCTRDSRSHLGVVAKRSYRFVPGRRAEPLAEEPEIVVETRYQETPMGPQLLADSDLCSLLKPATDVLASGTAYLPRGALHVDAGVRVGDAKKVIRAWGDRTIEIGPEGGPALSAPARTRSVPLDWSRAYGGRDAHAEARLDAERRRSSRRRTDRMPTGRLAYPRNPTGCGYFVGVEVERMRGTRAPNLEDPSDPVTAERLATPHPDEWTTLPQAAGFGPIDPFTFPRSAFLLPPELDSDAAGMRELATGELSDDDLRDRPLTTAPGPRLYSCASAGLGRHTLRGAERVALWHMHPDLALVESDLPGDLPRFVVDPGFAPAKTLEAHLRTVLVEADLERITLTWAGACETAALFPAAAARAVAHYVTWSR